MSAPLRQLRGWFAGRIERRVAGAVLGATLSFTAVITAASYGIAREEILAGAEAQLGHDASASARHVAFHLGSTIQGLAELSRSALLANALLDSEGRAGYVAPLLRDFRPSLGRAALTLCDYRGAPIASNLPAAPGFRGRAWLNAVVGRGEPASELSAGDGPTVLLLAFPVAHPETHQPEGVLVAELPFPELLDDVLAGGAERGGRRTRVLGPGGRVLATTGGDAAPVAWLTHAAAVPVSDPVVAAYALTVEAGALRELTLARLKQLAGVYAVGALVVIAAAYGAARLIGDRLTRRIRALAEAAADVTERGHLDENLAARGHDEIGHLGRAFNDMLGRLHAANEAKLAALRAKNTALVAAYVESKRLHLELQQAQKLEAVGRLAAGIAHEINTPIQFIGDNTRFLSEAFEASAEMLDRQAAALERHAPAEVRDELAKVAEDLDLAFVRERAPRTIERTLEGTQRVATIVRAMKEFAHSDRRDLVATDLNRALLATLEVARNEYKYVADVETELGELPLVLCHPGDLNQVFLNVVVNAAHAIADVVKDSGARGRIRVRTSRADGLVLVAVSDTGGGIPPDVQDKIFDPFFTTKEVGRGSGQGLAIARAIVEKHGGSITFETAAGEGTTFFVALPVERADAPAQGGAA